MREAFIEYVQEPFSNLIMQLTSAGKLHIKLRYTDWTKTDFLDDEIADYFVYKYISKDIPQHVSLDTMKKMETYDDKLNEKYEL